MRQNLEGSPEMENSHTADGKQGELVISNEFAEVRVRRVFTHNGVRLEIASRKLGFSICLDALQLESLTWQPPERFSAFLIEPFGPRQGQRQEILETRLDKW